MEKQLDEMVVTTTPKDKTLQECVDDFLVFVLLTTDEVNNLQT